MYPNGGIRRITISKVLWLQKGYLFKNLTKFEYNYVICPKCEGIMREAVIYIRISFVLPLQNGVLLLESPCKES